MRPNSFKMKVEIPISVGELLDKITILQIKSFVSDNEYVHNELKYLKTILNTLTFPTSEYLLHLREINEKLWKIEDKIRKKEKLQEFDDEFIELARSVYLTNDLRSKIKKDINEKSNSSYREIKIY